MASEVKRGEQGDAILGSKTIISRSFKSMYHLDRIEDNKTGTGWQERELERRMKTCGGVRCLWGRTVYM